jgi:hypothetical protein
MNEKRKNVAPVASSVNDSALTDGEFFEAHPEQSIRLRPIAQAELPRSLVGRNIRQVEIRNVSPDTLLLRFIDADAAWPAMLPVFDNDLFLTPEGRQKIVSYLNMMNGFSAFMASCARTELRDK